MSTYISHEKVAQKKTTNGIDKGGTCTCIDSHISLSVDASLLHSPFSCSTLATRRRNERRETPFVSAYCVYSRGGVIKIVDLVERQPTTGARNVLFCV